MSNKLVTSTIKVELQPLLNEKEATQYVKNLSKLCGTAANRVVSEMFAVYGMVQYIQKKKIFGEGAGKQYIEKFYKDHAIGDCSVQNLSYRIIADEFKEIPSFCKTALSSSLYKNFKSDYNDIIKGKKSPRNYKEDIPIPLNWSKKENDHHIDFSSKLLRLDKVDDDFVFTLGEHKFKLIFGAGKRNDSVKNSHKAVLERIWTKEYAFGDSSVEIKKNKIYLLLVYKFNQEKVKLDPDVIMGVDLGINSAVAFAFNKEGLRSGTLNGKSINLQGKEINMFEFRNRFRKYYTEMKRSMKFATGGRGRTQKLKALERLRDKERNYIGTAIHQLTREVINVALRNQAATIKLELLEGYGGNNTSKDDKLLSIWGYYQIQQRIIQKANQYGISVVFVDPYQTSQGCSTCGNVDPEQRPKEDRQVFKCKNIECADYGKIKNADMNAAKNIAKSEKVVESKFDCFMWLSKDNKERVMKGMKPIKKSNKKEAESFEM